jgi:S-layer protein
MKNQIVNTTASPGVTIADNAAMLLQQLYVAYFNRPADPGGLAFWTSTYLQGVSIAEISNTFARSDEYTLAYNGLNNTRIVEKVYQNLFGRAPEPGGLAFWSGLLDQHVLSISNVVTQIATDAKNQDAIAYHDKVLGAVAFTKEFDTTAEALAYRGDAAVQIARNFISNITDDASLATQTAPATLKQWVDLIVAPPPPPPPRVVVALTTGIDLIAPTTDKPLSGNDIINAFSTGSSDTLTSGDSIDGGAGSDILNIVSSTGNALQMPLDVTVKNVEAVVVSGSNAVTINTAAWSSVTTLNVSASGNANIVAGGNTSVSLTDVLGSGSGVIDGGNNLNLSFSGAQFGSSGVTVGHNLAASGSVSLNYDSATSGNGNAVLSVTGGSAINIAQTHSNAVNTSAANAPVTVYGNAQTTSVSISNAAAATASATVAGVQNNYVRITDVNANSLSEAGKIDFVSVSNYTTLSINDSALANLNLIGGSGNISIANGFVGTLAAKTLGIYLNGITGGTLDDWDVYTTMNMVAAVNDSRLDGITDSALTTLTLAGDKQLTLGSGNYLPALKTVTVTGAAGLSANLVATSLTRFDASATSGNNKITIDGSKLDYIGGAGADQVTLSAIGATHTVKVGSGADSVTLNAVPANLNAYTTILDPQAGMTLGIADKGTETFTSAKLVLANGAAFREYADAVIVAGGNASSNAAIGWFQYGNDTYVVESRHNGNSTNVFIDGTDFVVKLTGLFDLSHASFSSANGTLTLG